MRRFRPHPAAIALFVLTGLVYLGTLGNGLVWDDVVLVETNPLIKDLRQTPTLFGGDILPGGGGSSTYYRPLQMLSYAVDYAIWGLDPLGFHLTSVLLHALVVVLLYHLFLSLGGSRMAALAGAALWAVHPVHIEAVTYVSGRSDPLAAALMLTSLLLFAASRSTPISLRRALSLLALFAALLAREAALITVILVLIVDTALTLREGASLTTGWPRRLWQAVPYLGVAALYGGLRLIVLGLATSGASGATGVIALPYRLLTMLKTVALYLGFLVLPLDPHMERQVRAVTSVFAAPLLASALVCAGLVALAVIARQRAPLVSLGIGWFLVALLPVANIVPLATFMAEHWLYVPSMGLFLALGVGIGQLLEGEWRQAVACGLVVVLAAACGLTIRRNRDWRDSLSIFEATVAAAPESGRAWSNLGNTYLKLGQTDKAREALERSFEVYRPDNPERARALMYAGVLERNQGRLEVALGRFEEARGLTPSDPLIHNEIALTLAAMGQSDPAGQAFLAALELGPNVAAIHSNYGNWLFRRNDPAAALGPYRQAIRLDPDYGVAHNNLAAALYQLGQVEEAIAAYRRALELNPDNAEIRRNLAIVESSKGLGR